MAGRWTDLTARPAVATPRVMSVATGLLFIAGGSLALLALPSIPAPPLTPHDQHRHADDGLATRGSRR